MHTPSFRLGWPPAIWFIFGFYSLLVGSKVVVALIVERSKYFIKSKYYFSIVRTLGIAQIIFGLTFIKMGLDSSGVIWIFSICIQSFSTLNFFSRFCFPIFASRLLLPDYRHFFLWSLIEEFFCPQPYIFGQEVNLKSQTQNLLIDALPALEVNNNPGARVYIN